MIEPIEAGKTYIRTLRATSNEGDLLAFRLHVERLLATADLYPRGLSESAIVCIRSLRAQMPSARRGRASAGRLPAQEEEQLRTTLQQIITQAARPLYDSVSSNTVAVIFADRAEMLACLALDWYRHIIGEHWWWQSLFRGADSRQLVFPIWLETPAYIPAALALLANRREVVPFVRRLASGEARSLLQGITHSFALHTLQLALSSMFRIAEGGHPLPETPTPLSTAGPLPSDAEDCQGDRQDRPYYTGGKGTALAGEETSLKDNFSHEPAWRDDAGKDLSQQPLHLPQASSSLSLSLVSQLPWRKWVPESAEENLSLAQQALLGIGLMLVRAPFQVRATAFAHGIDKWSVTIITLPIPTPSHQSVPSVHQTDNESVVRLAGNTSWHDEEPIESRALATSSDGGSDTHVDAAATSLEEHDRVSLPAQPSSPPLASSEALSTFAKRDGMPSRLADETNHIEVLASPSFSQVSAATPSESSHPHLMPPQQPQALRWHHAESLDAEHPASQSTQQQDDIAWNVHPKPGEPYPTSQNPQQQDGERRLGVQRSQADHKGWPYMLDETEQEADRQRRPAEVEQEEADHQERPYMLDEMDGTPTVAPLSAVQDKPSRLVSGVPSQYGFDRRIHTAYGGLFYLLNLGLFLNLYNDFTTPLDAGIDLPIWDFVALLGEQMLGENIYTDPIWFLLAQLAGRTFDATRPTLAVGPTSSDTTDTIDAFHVISDDSMELLGRYFEPPSQWRIPLSWLNAFPETEQWVWCVAHGRLRVWHAAQFLVLDLPVEDEVDVFPQLRHALQPYAALLAGRMPELEMRPNLALPAESSPTYRDGHAVLRPLARPLYPALERWLAWLMPYIYARLQRALGLEQTDDLSALLCMHSAHVTVTATHLNIDLSLADLPIAIRMAGLDRDPGWLPAAGRFIAFHFH